ncbi:G2/mitotic-specific cyclin-B3 [Mesocricetus auratus]|uniref:G2/mitotic-specific cyclin-B3 n=1 Tax=Mesocricetus auratus TaxID=10036 RepID=A0A1U7R0W2_MESAU|nr:G2/mitotic-specific cyclin-B3 [Mesocricetus auratus]XP_021091633.1 G2/mitotic-specific cyclin-B3 [Mesocricetus auratus]XP_021091634.1 G2/mitotic-specific cyclin-B3 [Mesocricetus auratus]XP_021091636.1 G2/mitotic-specific cyclin-B3 [Mesocricetus auratus]XP_021091637.1 G2/mitotic-specific cyclin-B3 [Mesocricetus auratus]XP_021091638.1 G2/mitotic-specific cyclin-B3 [Mesocricetus auratus]XP_021091639.1 G2/mitotic-specific cyclin-B3 [Mesocricetus auratus]XP_040589678.1 G2/mitotic-specific cycl
MPPPLLPKSSKLEPEKAQPNKIVPSEEHQSEKSGEDNHTTSSPSFQDTAKKRSAFEDLTNAYESQTVQLKQEDNTELRSHASKRTSKEVGEVTQIKTSKLALVTSVSNIEKQFIQDIPTKSKALTTEKPSVFQKTSVLNEKPATEETSLMKKTLKKRAYHRDKFLKEQPVTLLEETEVYDGLDTELMTSEMMDEPKEADTIKEMIDSKKPATRKATLTSKATFTSSPLSLKNKPAIQEEKSTIRGKSSFRKKSSELKVVTTREKSVIRKLSFKKKHPAKEMKSLIQEPSLLKETYNAQGEASILKKPLVLQENTNNKDDILTESVTFKGKHSTNETTHTQKLISKNNRDTQGSIINFRSLGIQPVTHEHEPSSFKKSTTKKHSHFQGPTALPDKHIAHVEMSTVEKSLALQKPTTKEKVLYFHGAPVLKKQRSMEEAPRMKKHSSLKKKQHLPKRRHFFNNPAAQEPVTNEPLSFMKSTTEKEPPFQRLSALQKRHTSPGVLSKPKKLCAPGKHHMEEESHCQSASAFKKRCIMEEPAFTYKPLAVEMQQTFSQGTMFHLIDPAILQTATSGAESLAKEPLPFKKENTAIPKKKCATHITPLWPAQAEWLEKTDENKKLFSPKPGSLRNETVTGFQQNPSSLNKKCSILQKLPLPMSLNSQKTTSQEGAYSKESVSLNDDKMFFSPELFSPYSSAGEDTFKSQTDGKMGSHRKLFDSQDSVSEEEIFLRKLFCKDRYPSSAESSQERTVALEQEFVLNKILEENSSDVDECLGYHSLNFQCFPSPKVESTVKPLNMQEDHSMEKMAVLMKPLITQDNSTEEVVPNKYTTDTQAHYKQCWPLQETANFKEETIASQEQPRAELVTVLKELLVIVKRPDVEKVALAFQKKPPSNVEVLLNEVLELLEKPKIGGESTLEEPWALQENPSTTTEATLKKPLPLKENPSIERASPKEFLTFDRKPDTEKDDVTRKTLNVEESTETLALYEGLTAADQLFFTDLLTMEDTSIIDEEEFFKSFFAFPEANNTHMPINALESRAGDYSALVPVEETLSPVMSSSLYHYVFNDLKSAVGERQTEVIVLEDSDTVESIEKEDCNPALNSIYIKEIFIYLRKREENFIVVKYMDMQMELTSDMRAILVDWLVEVQTSFQMNHETLFLTVKLVDHYLMKEQCKKDNLQLLGSTAYMIAAKFEESYPPSLPEFLYICEDLYQQRDMVALEMNILKTLNFDINIPTAYIFLRRYASCVRASMKTLTLSRFICEMTLQEYDYVQERPSKLAAASFALALYMRNLNNCIPLLEHYTGYEIAELQTLVRKLNNSLIFQPHNCLKNVYEKYAEETFFEVSKIPPLDKDTLEEILLWSLLG